MSEHRPVVAAILVAAGSGERLGAGVPKAFVEIAGRTLLEHAAGRFADHPGVRDVIVAVPEASVAHAVALVPGASVVAGGASRQESVALGMAALAADVERVLVHDAARALVPSDVIDRVVAALDGADAVVPVVPVADTIRTAGTGSRLGPVVDRDGLRAVQTPQGFRRATLEHAHAAGAAGATDDAALVQAQGDKVVGVAGDPRAFKITVSLDLVLAEALLTWEAGGG